MTHHIPIIIWGMTDRTRYTVNGETGVWVQDAWYGAASGDTRVLRYTTMNGQGMMSVYRRDPDPMKTHDQRNFLADSDRTILCDERGNPTAVTGIQRYFPASVMCPAYWSPEQGVWWKRTEGVAVWWPGDNYPDSENGGWRYAHENAISFEESQGRLIMHHDENFYYMRADSPMSPPYWQLEYSRGYNYDVEKRRLLGFRDNLGGIVYDGISQD